MNELSHDAGTVAARPAGANLAELVHFRRDAQGQVPPREAARQFEQIFVQQLIRQMSSSLDSGFFGASEGSHVYQGFFETFLAQRISETGGIGMAPLIERGIERHGTS